MARAHSASGQSPRLTALLVTVGPAVLLFVPPWTPLGITAAALFIAGGLILPTSGVIGRFLATMAVGTLATATAPTWLGAPHLLLIAAIAFALVLAAVWSRGRPAVAGDLDAPNLQIAATRAHTSSAVTLVALGAAFLEGDLSRDRALAAAGTAGTAALFIAIWWLRSRRRVPRRRAGLLLASGWSGGFAAAGWYYGEWGTAVAAMGLLPVAALFLVPTPAREEPPAWQSAMLGSPARFVVGTFAALCLAGAVALSLPASSATARIDWLDAAFTAVSAVCVTGLIVVETSADLSLTGQALVLLLIQLGGLGIMTLYAALLQALGRRLSLHQEAAVAGTVSLEDSGRLIGAVRRVLMVTAAAELSGAVLLFLRFAAHDGAGAAAWRAVFTAISAFCNAGFALQPDSLVPYQSDAVVLHTVGALIVAGGLSPLAIAYLPEWVRRRRTPLPVKLILAASAALLAFGWVVFLAFEWNGELRPLPPIDRLHNAWFQSVTARTAGFNSLDTAALHPATQSVLMALMVIGGSPGSTAGGIKTTTAALVFLAIAAAVRGQPQVMAFGRQVAPESVYRATAVATAGLMALLTGIVALLLTQPLRFDVAVFEAVSALGTVGLSTGGTALLDGVGKAIVMVCMFAGRVGPLTLFLLLAERAPRPAWQLPEETVDVG